MGEYLAEPILGLKEPESFPCFPDGFLTSGRWHSMKDFQRGWYIQMLLSMTRSKPVGYLPYDERLWTLAGAHTRQHFEQHCALVLACFKVLEFGGCKWITNEPLLNVLCRLTFSHDKAVENGRRGGHAKQKHRKTPSTGLNNYSSEFEELWKNKTWKCVAKPQAFKAFTKALENIQQEKKITRDQAIEFLADAMEEFKTSPAGRAHGMFDGYSPPYPASWLNAQRYFDDRGTWRPGAANVAGAKGVSAGGTGAPKKSADPNCPRCGGSSWDTSSGKASRCECFKAR